jgi:hypothetical protein
MYREDYVGRNEKRCGRKNSGLFQDIIQEISWEVLRKTATPTQDN